MLAERVFVVSKKSGVTFGVTLWGYTLYYTKKRKYRFGVTLGVTLSIVKKTFLVGKTASNWNFKVIF